MSNVVMTGRRTKRPVRLMRYACSAAAAPPAALTAGASLTTARATLPTLPTLALSFAATSPPATATRVVCAANSNGRVRREARLTLDHHAVTVANSTGNDRQTASGSLDDYSTLPRRVGAIYDVDVCPALSRHDRLRRYNERTVLIE